MSITLQNAMKIGGLRDCKVIAGDRGLSKIVDNVTIMEVPDIIRWLKGKDLLLTSLYPLKDDPVGLKSFIQRLHQSGTTALAIKPYHFVKVIPQVILDQADELGFPIIEIPEEVSYLDILSPVMNAIFDNKVVLQEDLERASQVLREISLSDKSIEEFIRTLSHLTKNIITVESQLPFMELPQPEFNIEPLGEEEQSQLELIKHPIRLKRSLKGEDISCIVAPVLLDGRVYGNITCWGVNTDNLEIDLAILEKAASMFTLSFLKLKVKYDVEQQYKNDFIRELLFNESMNEMDLLDWGKKYKFEENTTYLCLLITGNSKQPELTRVNEVDHIVRNRWSEAIVGSIRDFICIILPFEDTNEQEIKKRCNILFNDLQNYVGSISCMAVGRLFSGIQGLRRSFFEAEQAHKLQGRTNNQGQVIYYNDLGVYRLLGQLIGKKELNDYYNDTIGKLAIHDANHELALIDTLKAYFLYNENLKESSQSLFIHVNTLKYRLNKISLVTNYSLYQSDEKMMLYLGLKIHEMIKA